MVRVNDWELGSTHSSANELPWDFWTSRCNSFCLSFSINKMGTTLTYFTITDPELASAPEMQSLTIIISFALSFIMRNTDGLLVLTRLALWCSQRLAICIGIVSMCHDGLFRSFFSLFRTGLYYFISVDTSIRNQFQKWWLGSKSGWNTPAFTETK